MSERYLAGAPEAQQQQGSLSLKEFAKLNHLTSNQAFNLAKKGCILGAHKTHGGRWLVFPPAKLLHRPKPRKLMDHQPKGPPEPLAAVAGFDFGTSPHGLPADCLQAVNRPQAVTRQAQPAPLLADGFDFSPPNGGAALLAPASGVPPSGTVMPEVFGSAQVKAAVRTIALGGSTLCYPVVLTGRQILAIENAIAHDLNGLEQQAEWHEFEPEQVALHDSQRATLQATLRTIRAATTKANQAKGRGQRSEVWK